MRVNLVFEGIPGVVKVVGKNVLELDMEGQTVADLLIELVGKYGEGISKILQDDNWKPVPSIQMVINRRDYIQIDRMAETRLSEGDTVAFITLLNGG